MGQRAVVILCSQITNHHHHHPTPASSSPHSPAGVCHQSGCLIGALVPPPGLLFYPTDTPPFFFACCCCQAAAGSAPRGSSNWLGLSPTCTLRLCQAGVLICIRPFWFEGLWWRRERTELIGVFKVHLVLFYMTPSLSNKWKISLHLCLLILLCHYLHTSIYCISMIVNEKKFIKTGKEPYMVS